MEIDDIRSITKLFLHLKILILKKKINGFIMSFFSSPEPEDEMGSLEERESYISEIIAYLSVSTIGELTWVQRYLERSFQKNLDPNNPQVNIFEQKKHEIENLLLQNKSMVDQISNIQTEQESVQKQIINLEKDITALTSEKEGLKQERDSLADELQRIAKLYEEMTGKQAKQEDLRDVLSIYITLMEEVFSGRAHFKVLSVMHGEKEFWTRYELSKSTGFPEITLRSVIGDLVRANMIDYDEENDIINLKKRLTALG